MPQFDIYNDTYFDILNISYKSQAPNDVSYGSPITFIRVTLALLLRAGFVLVQLGSIPIENVYIILLQNIVDIAISLTAFGLVGYILAFGSISFHGTLGHGSWIVSDAADLDNAVLGFSACIIATAIISTLLAGRLHFIGYFLTSFFFAAIFQPIIMHWIWHSSGWLKHHIFMDHFVSFKDYAGGMVVHFAAGVVGVIGALFLGRRLIKLSDIDESSIGADAPGSTLTGYIFIALGLIAFTLPSPAYEASHIPSNYIGLILVNNILAMGAGITVVVMLQFLLFREPFNYWVILRCIQGAIAGMVAISSGIDVYTPIIAYTVGCIAAVLFYFIVICVNTSSIEDYCNIVPIHLVCGFLGILLPPLLGHTENLGRSTRFHVNLIHLGWQLVGILAVSALLISIFTVNFGFLEVTSFLRNKPEEINHRRGATAADRGPQRCCLQRLFFLNPGTPYIEPGAFGKSPQQFYAYSNAPNYAANTAEMKFGKKAAVSIEPVRVATVTIDYNSTPFQTGHPKSIDYDSIPFQTRKPKSIYTINYDHTVQVVNPCINGGGDSRRNIEEEDENTSKNYLDQKLNEVAISVGKQCSYHELHRTKKHTNLLRDRYAIKKKVQKTVREIIFPQSAEFTPYDNKYNDGFVTIKMPVKGDLSDSSE